MKFLKKLFFILIIYKKLKQLNSLNKKIIKNQKFLNIFKNVKNVNFNNNKINEEFFNNYIKNLNNLNSLKLIENKFKFVFNKNCINEILNKNNIQNFSFLTEKISLNEINSIIMFFNNKNYNKLNLGYLDNYISNYNEFSLNINISKINYYLNKFCFISHENEDFIFNVLNLDYLKNFYENLFFKKLFLNLNKNSKNFFNISFKKIIKKISFLLKTEFYDDLIFSNNNEIDFFIDDFSIYSKFYCKNIFFENCNLSFFDSFNNGFIHLLLKIFSNLKNIFFNNCIFRILNSNNKKNNFILIYEILFLQLKKDNLYKAKKISFKNIKFHVYSNEKLDIINLQKDDIDKIKNLLNFNNIYFEN